jgi:hypothetical protein
LQAREAAAYHEADRIGREAIEEMLALNGARWRSPNGTAGR